MNLSQTFGLLFSALAYSISLLCAPSPVFQHSLDPLQRKEELGQLGGDEELQGSSLELGQETLAVLALFTQLGDLKQIRDVKHLT